MLNLSKNLSKLYNKGKPSYTKYTAIIWTLSKNCKCQFEQIKIPSYLGFLNSIEATISGTLSQHLYKGSFLNSSSPKLENLGHELYHFTSLAF